MFSDEADYLDRYPGDDYVDIMGLDDYHDVRINGDKDMLGRRLGYVRRHGSGSRKIAAFTETGQEKIPEKISGQIPCSEQIMSTPKSQSIAYVMVWRNARFSHHYGPYKGHPSTRNFKKFVNDDRIWMMKDLPKWQKD